jgi:hypothetical protein
MNDNDKKFNVITDIFCKVSIFDQEKRELEKKFQEVKKLYTSEMNNDTLLAVINIKAVVTRNRHWQDNDSGKIIMKKAEIHYQVTDFVKECNYPNFLLFLVLYASNGEVYKFSFTSFNEEGDRHLSLNRIVSAKRRMIKSGASMNDSYTLIFARKQNFDKIVKFCNETIKELNQLQFYKIKKVPGM